eukprot:TRINITY_DN10549_c0_g2_i1.p2 TRINITY_DN10549_c0_g2~~TRINITY_DN10549_c0_g2_i1.p2  ORF type:complete len:210 (-),score=49.81 TRINITY_DN10549_c0_g2_i1:1053-1682(-)
MAQNAKRGSTRLSTCVVHASISVMSTEAARYLSTAGGAPSAPAGPSQVAAAISDANVATSMAADPSSVRCEPSHLCRPMALPTSAAAASPTPSAMSPHSCGWALPQLCGLIALGVGDAAAALVGSAMGRHKWLGSQRTLEGSAAMLVATFASLMAAATWLGPAGADGAPPAVLRYLAASVLITLMEAWTTQVDNLVLPLFAFCAMALVT